MSAPRCLDLFCGAFGAGHGYQRAGYEVTGVDFVTRSVHPLGVTFIKADVLDVLADVEFLRTFDLIHASPPCKVHTRLGSLRDAQGGTAEHPDLLDPTRDALDLAGVPYVLENVEGAPMRPDVVLCGSMFGLEVTDDQGRRRWLKRHRVFELGGWGDHGLGIQLECDHPRGRVLGIYGKTIGDQMQGRGEVCGSLAQAQALMDTPWMSWRAITQAIPPAYTEHLGRHALERIGVPV